MMVEPVAEITPETEKVPSVYHDAQPEFSRSKTPMHKDPAPRSTGSDGTAASQCKEGPSSAATNTKNTITEGQLEKNQPLVDTKQQPNIEGHQTTSPAATSSPVPASETSPSYSQTARERATTAESGMTAEAKANLTKSELNKSKKITKVLKKEQREQDQALKALIKDFNKHQSVHRSAIRDESKVNSKHAKAVKLEHKTNKKLLSAQGKHDKAAAELKQRTETLAKKKEHTSTQGALLQQKTKELEEFRARKAVEDRERQAKINALSQNPAGV